MNITTIPFNQFIGIKEARQPANGTLELEGLPQYQNHLGTVHASAQFALAEACSGEYLLRHFGESAEGYFAVARKAEIKFRQPASGSIYAQAQVSEEQKQTFLATLQSKGRAFITVAVAILDTNGTITMNASIEMYVQKAEQK